MTRLLKALTVVLALILWSRPAAAEDRPPVADERIVLHTIAGDLVLALYPTIAPQTVEQLLKLARAGVYDTTAFVRIEPAFVAQISAHWDRTKPLTDEQKALIKKIPAELDPSVKHGRLTLSMAREDADINSAESSFSILLNSAPHLDGKYTIFGRVVSGLTVLEDILVGEPITRVDLIPS